MKTVTDFSVSNYLEELRRLSADLRVVAEELCPEHALVEPSALARHAVRVRALSRQAVESSVRATAIAEAMTALAIVEDP